MKKHIEINTEMRQNLMKIFGCSRVWIWKALNYESDAPKCRKIRYTALKMGGRVVDGEDTDPVTSYEDGGSTMVQTYGTRVRLTVDMSQAGGEYRIEVDGKEKQRGCAQMSIADFMKVQARAEMLAKSL